MNDPITLWFIAGALLILAEFMVPGVVIVFFGVGALITSLTTWLGLTASLTSQTFMFGASSVVLLFSLRHLVKSWFVGKSDDENGDLDDDFTGREALVTRDIPGPGIDGRIEIKGSEWKARAESTIVAGTPVIISGREGLTFHVRKR
ncbi:NfeD family protein [Haloferula chungangensis]|uniref:NfeD family protein n=1 Tax=Haloferula chungangensis TaxID=1048331 RepID=A0ABW2L7V3_9BACT